MYDPIGSRASCEGATSLPAARLWTRNNLWIACCAHNLSRTWHGDNLPRDLPYRQPLHNRPFKRRREALTSLLSKNLFATLALILLCFTTRTDAAYVTFQNCMPDSIVNSNPLHLQWIPLFVDASFIESSAGHHLNLTIYGNVSGQVTVGTYPSPDSPSWSNPSDTFGKIVNISASTNVYTTLYSKYNVLTYTPYEAAGSPFWESTGYNSTIPMAPVFYANASDPHDLRVFSVGHEFASSFAFSTIDATVRVQSGDQGAPDLACISANITPDLGGVLTSVLTFLPMVVLLFVAISTLFAGMFSPWGTLDPFRWTSNYGRDQDLLRLVTPGFGDCLQYIQFIVLSGSLTLQYPGYYQPVVSQVSWSALMFNESFVSHGSGTQSLIDGIYVTNSTYGLGSMSQLVGFTHQDDMWAGMVIWLLVIIAVTATLCQIGFISRWFHRLLINNAKEDLRSKNLPFTGGMLVRIVCNFFLLPLVALSMFQLVINKLSPGAVTAMAVILLVAIVAFAGWILRLIITTEPRSHLFDDLPTVLLYGPLYNTYSDDAAPFALIPAMLTFIRGLAIGAVQPSGIAQLVILAICEVILILTLHAFRPFHSPTYMNAYHTFFASVRLASVLLMVSFVPSLGVTQPPKGWIGYVILLLHAIVLIFGFFLNAVQRIVEVVARLAGAGGEEGTGAATRGGLVKVFGVRQLSRRRQRPQFRNSMTSDAAVLTDDADAKSTQFGTGRSRSASANSRLLLNKTYSRVSNPLDQSSPNEMVDSETPYEHSTFSFLPGPANRPELALRTSEPSDPYYRAPRPRRQTGELMTPGAKSRSSWISGDWANKIAAVTGNSPEQPDHRDSGSGWPMAPLSPPPQQATPVSAYRSPDDIEATANGPRTSNVDYAVRESDFYYGVRGPALSSQATRKLKTGPADPVGPASSASGWFRGMFGRKNKESGKGFEVVRSSRAPPAQFRDGELSPQIYPEQYQDSPQSVTEAYLPGQRTRSGFETIGEDTAPGQEEPSPVDSDDGRPVEMIKYPTARAQVREMAPSLGSLDLGEDIELPSRFNSRVSRRNPSNASARVVSGPAPALPRKSSRRSSQTEGMVTPRGQRLSTVLDGYESRDGRHVSPPPRLPFYSPTSPNMNRMSNAESIRLSIDEEPTIGRVCYHNVTHSNTSSLVPPSTAGQDRPTSVGYVNMFRARDSVRPGLQYGTHTGSSAELINDLPALRRRSVGSEREEQDDL